MSEEQLTALLAKLKEDSGLKEKLQGAGDLDAAAALAKEAGFDVRKEDWLNYQANQTMELSDADLEEVAGGKQGDMENTYQGKYTMCKAGACGGYTGDVCARQGRL